MNVPEKSCENYDNILNFVGNNLVIFLRNFVTILCIFKCTFWKIRKKKRGNSKVILFWENSIIIYYENFEELHKELKNLSDNGGYCLKILVKFYGNFEDILKVLCIFLENVLIRIIFEGTFKRL